MAERLTISDIRQHQREGCQFHPSSYSARLEDSALAALAEVESLRAENERLQLLLGAKSTEAALSWIGEVESLRTQLAAARGEIERMPLVDAMIPAFVDDPVAHRLGFHDADCDGNHDASTARAQAVMDLESDLAAVRTDLSEARAALQEIADMDDNELPTRARSRAVALVLLDQSETAGPLPS